MSFLDENQRYEAWLRQQCDVVEDDLKRKHKKMRKDAFSFLRATFFRWSGLIEALRPDLKGAPAALAVGDAHVENFGTWRDSEGRLVWGINDFDDAASIPYVFDLVRLATSAQLAPQAVVTSGVADSILRGYRNGLAGPRPTLLDEQETWMREKVACSDEDRVKFWSDIDALPSADPKPAVVAALVKSLPSQARIERYASRVKGGGSLGRPRFVAIAKWRGGRIVREAKALVTSGWDWAHNNTNAPTLFLTVATGDFRSADPFLALQEGFILRRVAADSRKVELEGNADALGTQLIEAMGFDLAAIHAATCEPALLLADLNGRPAVWLTEAAETAAGAVKKDFDEWLSATSK
jgi:hypothetical protein